MKKRILTILGARPQFIKAAAVSRAILEYSTIFEEKIIHTGQHYDRSMSDLFFDELNIPLPYKNLGVGSGSHGEQTGEMLKKLEPCMQELKPDIVVVYGDTNSTLAGALVASKLHIPIAHVEAGLRSFNKKMPEEINRIITDHISDFLFSPTTLATGNLLHEGFGEQQIYQVGDVMYDAIKFYQKKSSQGFSEFLSDHSLSSDPFILVTIHRAENTDNVNRLTAILDALNDIAHSKMIIFPVHPRTKKIIQETYSRELSPNLKLIEPIGYLQMLSLQEHCQLVVTDSGGLQKEAFLNQKYCLTVREETEWQELVDGGFNFLVIPDEIAIRVANLWNKPFDSMDFQPYGTGSAAEKIVRILEAAINQ